MLNRAAVGHFHLSLSWLPVLVAKRRSLTSTEGELVTGASATKNTAGKGSPVVASVARSGEGS